MLCNIVIYFSNIWVFILSELHLCFVLILVFREMVAYIANTLIFILRYGTSCVQHVGKISGFAVYVHLSSWSGLLLLWSYASKWHSCKVSHMRIPFSGVVIADGVLQNKAHFERHGMHHVNILKFTSICPLGRGRVFPI